jgi:hypothetical protein
MGKRHTRHEQDKSFYWSKLILLRRTAKTAMHLKCFSLLRQATLPSTTSAAGSHHSMTLPEGIDEDRVKASFNDGLLEVTVEGAGKQAEEGSRRIEIGD